MLAIASTIVPGAAMELEAVAAHEAAGPVGLVEFLAPQAESAAACCRRVGSST